jgi:formylglycine-generating enzyme required for sulfatase activity
VSPSTPPLAIAPFDEKTAKQHQEAWAKYLNVPVEITNSIGMRFVLIPPGEFEFLPKWDGDGPRVKITKAFYLGQYEVTQEQYFRIMGNNPSEFQGESTRPVEMVRWTWTADFCQRLSLLPRERALGAVYRLPTEAEWEYACRAGANPREQVGEYASGVLGQYAWHKENSNGQTHPVGQLRPNAWGLFDMRGNVAEWLADWYEDIQWIHANTPQADPQGPASGTERVMRGYSFRHEKGDGFRWLWRDHFPANGGGAYDMGFRVVMLLAR